MVAITDFEAPASETGGGTLEDLRRLGITPIDPARVQAHIAADNRRCRPTWKHHLLGISVETLLWGALVPVLKLLLPRMDMVKRWQFTFVVSVLLAVSSLGWATLVDPNTWLTLALVPIVAWIVLGIILVAWAHIFNGDFALEEAVAYWRRHHPRSMWNDLPPDVQALVNHLETELPGEKLRVYARGDDPVLEVGDKQHIAAAWDTGDADLNFVPIIR